MPSRKHQQMGFLVFGAGAIGTYLGGSLALAGQRVVFYERPEMAAMLSERGLRLKIGGEAHYLPNPSVVSSMDEALTRGPYDVGIFAVKSFDTAGALEGLAPYKVALPPLLSLQNGVENEVAIGAALGADRVIAGTVTSAVGRLGAGDIVLERKRGVGIANEHPLAPALVSVFNSAGLGGQLYRSAGSLKWSKLLTNLLANASSAILDLTPAEIFSDPRLARLEVEQLRETLRVMRRLDLGVVNLPGTPVRLLAAGVQFLPARLAQPLLRRAVGGGRGKKMPSFHIDLHSQRGKSEVEYLNGAVARFGERLGVPTPVNLALTETLLSLTRRELPLERFRHAPVELLKIVEQKRGGG